MHVSASTPTITKDKAKKRNWWFQKVGMASEKAANVATDVHEHLPNILCETTTTLQAVQCAAWGYANLIGYPAEGPDPDDMTVVQSLGAFQQASNACQSFFSDQKLKDSVNCIQGFTAKLNDFDVSKFSETVTNATKMINKLTKSIQDDISPLFRVLFFVGIPLILLILSCLGLKMIPNTENLSYIACFAVYVAELAFACCGIGCAFAVIFSTLSFILMIIRMYTGVL